MNTKNPRILILFLIFGDIYKGSLETFIDEYCLPLKCQKRLIVIENADENMYVRQKNDWIYEIGGDNSVFEFSGWQKAIESEAAQNFKPDVYLFVNSSLYTHRFYSMPIVTDEIIDIISQHKVFSGKIQKRSFKLTYEGLDLNLLVATHFFLIHREIIEQLGSIVSEHKSEKFVKPKFSPDIFTENQLWSGLLRKDKMTELTLKYHKKGIRVSPEYHKFFARKILTITNELLLSGRIKKLGYKIVDSTPFPKFFNSYYTIFAMDTTIRPFQFIRKIILMPIYYLFSNRLSEKIGLKKWFSNICAKNAKRHLLKQIKEV
jgi:hypothetical protein